MSFGFPTDSPSRWRDVYAGAAARAVAACGNFTAVTALVLTLQPVGGLAVSALILASTVPVVALAPLAGRLADRVDSRTLLVIAGSTQVVIALTLASAGSGHLVAVVALMGLLGAGQAVINPTLAALTPSMVHRDDLPRASAINQTAAMIGMLSGPAIGGVLVGTYGVRLPLLLNAASLLAIVAAALLIRTRRGSTAASARRPEGPTGAGVSPGWRLRHDPLLRAAIGSLAAVVAVIGAINVVDVFLIRETLGASEATYGLLEVTWIGGMLLGSWLLAGVARRSPDDGALLYGLLVTLATLSAMFPLAAGVGAAVWLVPLWIIAGAGNGGLNVYTNVLVARRVPERMRGRAYATLGATVHGAGMAGYAAGGPLVETLPIRPLVAGLGIAGVAAVALLTVPVVRTVRRDRESSRPQPADRAPVPQGR